MENVLISAANLEGFDSPLYHADLTLDDLKTNTLNVYGGTTVQDCIIQGNLTVNGTQTIINTETVNIQDPILNLHTNFVGNPIADCGLRVERGNLSDASFLWNETSDKWVAGVIGSESVILTTNNTETLTNKTINVSQLTGTLSTSLLPSLVGDITSAVNTANTTIANNAVTFPKMQNIATNTLLGRLSASSGNVETLDATLYTTNSGSQTLTNKTSINGMGILCNSSGITLSSSLASVLLPSNSGTLTAMVRDSYFTTGSIPFVNTAGTSLTQQNSRLFWDQTNYRLGLGTLTPASKLHIYGDSDSTVFEGISTTSHCFMSFYPRTIAQGRKGYFGFASNSTTNLTLMNEDTGYLKLGSNTVINMTLTGSFVGIATESPVSRLHLFSTSAIADTNIIRLATPNSGTATPVRTRIVFGCDGLGTGDISSSIDFIRVNASSNNYTNIAFRTYGGGTSGSDVSVERARINEFGYFGLGTASPTHLLHLNADDAFKPTTTVWTNSSDERLKTNIILADLDICYNNIKNIPLKKYTWRDDIFTEQQANDRSKLGWIAQEVQTIFPKAVTTSNMYGYEDCLSLNVDQIYATMYGTIQKLQILNDEKDLKIDLLTRFIKSKFEDFDTFV